MGVGKKKMLNDENRCGEELGNLVPPQTCTCLMTGLGMLGSYKS